jgi:transposase
VSGLRIGYKGKSGYLSQAEKAEIIAWLNNKEMWDIAELAIHIEEKYEVIYQSQQSYYFYLNQLKLVGKSPKRRIPKETPNW